MLLMHQSTAQADLQMLVICSSIVGHMSRLPTLTLHFMQSQFPVSWSGQSASLRRENDVVVLVVKIGRNGKKKKKKKKKEDYVM